MAISIVGTPQKWRALLSLDHLKRRERIERLAKIDDRYAQGDAGDAADRPCRRRDTAAMGCRNGRLP